MFLVAVVFLLTNISGNLYATQITTPEAGTEYYIVHSSGNYLTNTGETAFIAAYDANNANQKFVFESYLVDGEVRYDLKCVGTGTYMYRDNWMTQFNAEKKFNTTYYTIEAVTGNNDFILIHSDFDWGKNSLGVDSNAPNSNVWSNKDFKGNINSYWYLAKVGELDKISLQIAINNATKLVDSAPVGTTQGRYSSSSISALRTAITSAQNTLNTATSQETINTAATNLFKAIDIFKTQVIPFIPDENKTYIAYYSDSNFALSYTPQNDQTNKWDNAQIIDYLPGDSAQIITLTPVLNEAGKYNIKNLKGQWLKISGGWDTKWGIEDEGDINKFKFETIDTVFLQIKSGNGYLGATKASGNDIYSNWGAGNYFRIVERTEGIDKQPLQDAITEANNLKNNTVIGTGQGQYTQTVFDTFVSSISLAQDVISNPVSQTNVNNAIIILRAAINTFKSGMNKFVPDFTKVYTIFHSSGLVLSSTIDNYSNIVSYVPNTNTQLFKLEEVPGIANTYFIKNMDNNYMKAEGGWDVMWLPTNDGSAAFQFKIETIDQIYVRMKSINGYVGTSSTTDPGVYSDKNGNNSCYFTFTAQNTTAIIERSVDNINIYSANGLLHVTNLTNATVSIYLTTGQLLSKTISVSGSYTKALHSDLYIVTINEKAHKVLVK